jgi:hypothetical protein
MHESPVSATAYEVLGVSPTATDADLRRAYRRLARETHPDLGGSAERFNAVQLAWERVGTPGNRAAYDRGRGSAEPSEPATRTWSGSAAGFSRADSRPRARSHGHPGGLARERFLKGMREWAGRGAALPDPYDPALVRSAPLEIRHALADALAEEATAGDLASLGIGFTLWHDVAAGRYVDQKIDHVVLGPSGLFALASEDWGVPVRIRRGDVVPADPAEPGALPLAPSEPLHELASLARGLGKATRTRFSAAVLVLPDAALEDSMSLAGKSHGIPLVVVRRSRLLPLLRSGLPEAARAAGTDLFEVRTRLQSGITFA